MSKQIEGKLVAHDRHQFELKLGYNLEPDRKRNKFNVELFLFIPRSLGINRDTYLKSEFYEDIQSYIRFRTPVFTCEEIANRHNPVSPLSKTHRLIDEKAGDKKIIAEIKLFACAFRVSIRNQVTAIRRHIKTQAFDEMVEDISSLCAGIDECLSSFRTLEPKLDSGGFDEDVKISFRHADEFIGIAIDGLLNSLNNTLHSSFLDKGVTEQTTALLRSLIEKEYEYRKAKGFATYEENSDNELFLHRKSILKKLVTGILFLTTHTMEGSLVARDLIFAISAGIAMIIATVVTLWAGQKWGSTSIPFVLAIVIGYMAKDRIKDWLKYLFSRKMTRWFSDYKTDILDPASGRPIGSCRHAFSFLAESQVPANVMKLRRQELPPDFWLPEDIIKYEKSVELNPMQILKTHASRRDITDIIRYNIHDFLERMDEPFEIRTALDPKSGETKQFRFARTYHVNLILKLQNELRRIRLIMNQNGINRIEEVVQED